MGELAAKGQPSPVPEEIGEKRLEAAIMFTDIVGYTSLSQSNESLALKLLEEHRKILRPLFFKFNGSEIKTIGDAFLVAFADPLDAVRCGYEMQRSLRDRNLQSKSESAAIRIRIGIHYGDVVYRADEKDVYGNCVNISSRIEPLADPGGICITGQVYDAIRERSKKDLEFENLGEHDLKNVEAPIAILRVVLPWEEEREEEHGPGRKGTKVFSRLHSSFFVDRDLERSQLSKLLDRLTASQQDKDGETRENKKLIIISGEAGVGKTRLLDWFVGECMQHGVDVARGCCQADISVPYFPLAEAFSKFLSERQGRPLAGPIDVASWLRVSARTGSSTSRDQMFEGTLRLLARLSARNPFALFVEDIQWADSSTLALLHYLARNISHLNVLIVCTYRAEEEGTRLLKETLLLMSRESLFREIELARLDNPSIREIAASVLGPTAPPGILESLARESGGNPLYAVEYAHLLTEEKGDRVQAATKGGTFEMPRSVYDVILRRLDRLSPEGRRLVNCGSLIGERFEPKLVSDTLGLDLLATLELLDAVARKTRILREEIEGSGVSRFFFDHAKVREVVLKELSTTMKIELHRRIAYVLLNTNREERLEEIIFHFHEGGVSEKVLELAPLAGDRARSKYAYAEALLYYDWALEGAGKMIGSLDDEAKAFRLRALIGRAESQSALGQSEQALRNAEEILRGKSDASQRLRAIRICAESCFDIGHFTESLKFCELDEVDERQTERETIVDFLRIKQVRATITGYRGDPITAISELAEIAEKLKSLEEPKRYALALLSQREFQLTTFDMEGALRSAEEAKSVLSGLGDLEGEMAASQSMAGVFSLRGEAQQADSNYSRAAELGNKLGLYGNLAWIYLYWGLLHEAHESHEKALDLTLKGLECTRFTELPYVESAIWASLTRFYLRASRSKEAEDACAQMNKLFQEHGKEASLTLKSAVQRSLGMYYAVRGENELADSEYLSSIELAHKGPLGPYHEVGTRMEYAHCLTNQNRIREARIQLVEALEIYTKLMNDFGIKRVRELLRLLGIQGYC